MTVQERATVTYQVTGTPDEVRTKLTALSREGQLVHRSRGWQEPSGRVTVNVRVLAQAREAHGSELSGLVKVLVKAAVALVPVGGAGVVCGVYFADAIGEVLAVLGLAGAALFLLYALVTVRHRFPGHSCARPGCMHR